MTGFIESAFVTCPRCADTQPARTLMLDYGLRREYLTLENGRIKQSGQVERFTLESCGCQFDAELWTLRVRTEASTRGPGAVGVRIEPRFHDQPPGIHPDSSDLPGVKEAAVRVGGFLSAWGDGLIDEVLKGNHKLFARDIEALREHAESHF